MFETEFRFFRQHQTELVTKHHGKTLVLSGEAVVAVHDTLIDAFKTASEKYPAGSFMLQPCLPGPSAYTVTVNLSFDVGAA